VLGTVQGDADTVPYHTQRLLKSAALPAIFAVRQFPARRNQLSVTVPCCVSAAVSRKPGEARMEMARTSLGQCFPVIVRALKTTKMTWFDVP
jgi:hypothetical protein